MFVLTLLDKMLDGDAFEQSKFPQYKYCKLYVL